MACVTASWRHRCVPLFETVLVLRILSVDFMRVSTILKKLDTNTGQNSISNGIRCQLVISLKFWFLEILGVKKIEIYRFSRKRALCFPHI